MLGGNLKSTIIHCDNQSCMKLSKNPMFHDRSKHIDMRHHFIRDMVYRGAMRLQYIRTDEKIVYVFTKPLSLTKCVYFRYKLGIAKNVSLDERDC